MKRLLLAVVVVCSGCESSLAPSSSIVGDWSGRVAPSHFQSIHIRFTQRGSKIEGVACRVDPSAGLPPERMGVLERDLPVMVAYPVIRLTMKDGRFTFFGTFQPDGTIKGNHNNSGEPYPMEFGRGGNYCGL